MKEVARKAIFVSCSGCTRLSVSSPPHAEHVQILSSWILMFVCFPAASDAASQILILWLCQVFLIYNLPTGQNNERPVPNYSYKASTHRLRLHCSVVYSSDQYRKIEKKTPWLPINIYFCNKNETCVHLVITYTHLLVSSAGVSFGPASYSTASGQT